MVALFTSIGYAQHENSKRSLDINDHFQIKRVGSPKLSPNGKWVAYTVSQTSLEEEKSETRIWMKSIGGGKAIPITMKGFSASDPQWSPDGKYLSFISSRKNEHAQVWILNRKGGEGQQLTSIKQGVREYTWSPDGKKLALAIKDTVKKKDEKKPEPTVITQLKFKRDYTGYLDTLSTHLYTFDLDADSLVQVTSGQYSESNPVWSPDGSRIAFVSNRTKQPDTNSNSDIWVVDANNSNKKTYLKQITTNPGSDRSPTWSPDGKSIAYITDLEPDIIWYATNHLAISSTAQPSATVLTKSLDRNVSSPHFSKDGESIYVKLEDSGENQLARVDIDDQTVDRLIKGDMSLRAYDLSPDGTFAALIAKTDLPSEVFTFKNGKLAQFTKTNQTQLDSLQLARVENINFKSKDGTPIEGFLTLPIDYEKGKKYPTLLRIHGGPVAQFSFSFNFEAQLFAANGYVVVQVNPRGSSGYGQEFSYAIWQNWGDKDFEDVMAGVDYAIKEGYADPNRLGVGGWSYGGVLTNHVITETSRFKAAITGASEVLYTSNYGHDQYYLQWTKEMGAPWKNQKAWDKISPFWDVEKITTPTLIMGGAIDWNVPIINSEQLYQALKEIGKVDTKLVVYPGEHHGIRKPSFQKDRLQRYLDWYGNYLK
jgi:dipeptidyl aminopeptidase/acylaminoacyl peptidase